MHPTWLFAECGRTVAVLMENAGEMKNAREANLAELICAGALPISDFLEGRFVSLSAFVVLLSVVFWGWLWGIPGSFVGLPMTLALVIWADEFNVSRWLYTLTAGSQR